MTKERIGFIGLGIMGKRMALNLLKAGYSMTIRSGSEETRSEFAAKGVQVAQTPAEVAAESDVIITMLPGSPEVEEVVLGENGIIKTVRAGSACIDTSSIDPVTSVRIASELRKKGVFMLDAPVSGGQEKAESGTLSIMAGGDEEVFERCRAILQSMGKDVVLVGGSGAGQIAKLVNQCIVAVNMAIVGEAMCLGKKAGVDPRKIFEAIRGGLAGSQCMTDKAPRMFSGDYSPGGKMWLHVKDLKNVMTA
ncbi:MAG: NAD-binding protein, partial [Synergistaceae bacterium]|nr:NAD-binding protein [Synergistaceae bacterium]